MTQSPFTAIARNANGNVLETALSADRLFLRITDEMGRSLEIALSDSQVRNLSREVNRFFRQTRGRRP